MRTRLTAAILVLAGAPVFAHRLDEYLQGTILSVEKNRVQLEMTLTPGVIVFPLLIPDIDTDANGVISEAEQRAYAGRVLTGLSLTIDGHRLAPRLTSIRFPGINEMREGQGEIQLEFDAYPPRGGRNRKLTFENHHQSRIAAYQVNCLIPRDPHIRIAAQKRNYSQSVYELDYEETDVPSEPFLPRLWPGGLIWLSLIALPLFTILAFVYWQGGWLRHLRRWI